MKIFKSFQQLTNTRSGRSCKNCAHFKSDPAFIEKEFPGLTTMSSGYASVRDKDGLCTYNGLYLSAWDSCPGFTLRTIEEKLKAANGS